MALPLGELAAKPTERAKTMTILINIGDEPSQSPAVTALPKGEPRSQKTSFSLPPSDEGGGQNEVFDGGKAIQPIHDFANPRVSLVQREPRSTSNHF